MIHTKINVASERTKPLSTEEPDTTCNELLSFDVQIGEPMGIFTIYIP